MPLELSRLRRVAVRDVWPSESRDFTPWLSGDESLAFLGEALGMELELEDIEVLVGSFRADLVCRSMNTGDLVLVENQFAQTDHSHLGQLLTYAAGLRAATIVWIAETIREEHRAAIDWLNESTDDDLRFFALEIELWRIDGSPAAPKFNIVCRPNAWSRELSRATGVDSEQARIRQAYWTGFVRQPALASILSGAAEPNRKGNLTLPTRWTDFELQVCISPARHDSAVYLSARGDQRLQNFDHLHARRQAIEEAAGGTLIWNRNDGLNRGWIMRRLPGLDPCEADDWPRQQEILAAEAARFFLALDPFVREIISTPEAAADA